MNDFWYYNTFDSSPIIKSGPIELMDQNYCIINNEKIPVSQVYDNKPDAVEGLCDYIEWETWGLEN